MIETIHLENFKNLADTTINLGRLTALVGPNGAGKTSILEAVHKLSTIARKGQLDAAIDLRKGREELVRWGTDKLSISAEGSAEDERWLLRITIPPETPSSEENRENTRVWPTFSRRSNVSSPSSLNAGKAPPSSAQEANQKYFSNKTFPGRLTQ